MEDTDNSIVLVLKELMFLYKTKTKQAEELNGYTDDKDSSLLEIPEPSHNKLQDAIDRVASFIKSSTTFNNTKDEIQYDAVKIH